ncbi:putative leucine-rich repeat receptor-like serine/threonine-protein kinase [Sesamum alatum]|uniref:non-specific serine/threonine protein kinase n=1 Tax=Sesamum alatum TaxID=300844 RepID=A0AAE2CYF4_9LAMI|nr:putative leucine-rich repeat receptor-like serine/threonine-protein kinase [Sesamum alatum]
MFFPRLLIVFICLVGFASGQARLPADEVESLRAIERALGKRWNFSVDPCSGLSGWVTQNPIKGFENGVVLKRQNLNGSVPRELVRLPFLQEIDLSRNYLNGTIPKEWGAMKLLKISLLGNRVTGSIPKELANITTLLELVLEANQLSGTIPPEFGNLPGIERICRPNLANLMTLKEFRISDNNFSGSIPDFIQSWTNIENLQIQASGLAGPIPSGIGSLTKLTDLRISDLNGNESTFPPLSNIINLDTLILRSCNVLGELPYYLGTMTTLDVLDLSFNKLSGPIPNSFVGLSETDYIYLTGNFLNGPLPPWMLERGDQIDLSYNNLTAESSDQNCQLSTLNLFASSKGNTSGIASCLSSSHCKRSYYSLHINCGGKQAVDDKGIAFQGDSNPGGPSNFFLSEPNWGFSSTGHFLNDDRPIKSFILSNSSSISGENSQLYMDARLSPLSLTYYGFCLINGNYTVYLHFAEIVFTYDRSYYSLGRRIFDVYIQGKLVLKDFNIENEAGGVNKGIRRNFTAVVTDGTLDIRLYWAGKGTNSIPSRGVYGPLISAISVMSDSPPPSENRISAGAIVGIVVGFLVTVLLVLGILWWKGCLRRKHTLQNDLKGLELHTGLFTLRQIRAATNNFDPAHKIGEGGFGPVYKGILSDGNIIAVKQLSSKSKQGNREFVNEIGMISALQHPHLVKLYGCCIEGDQLLLVYEYMENNSLARALFGSEEHQIHLDWPTRHRICIGIARGLAYLHEESRLKIVHRDIKATNVLLDKNLVPKISDFGLAKLDEEDNTHISTRIAGTFGYMAPEYAMRGYLTDKADVYSFGVVLLEVVSGRTNTSIKTKENAFYLLDWANSLKKKGNLMELVDPRLEPDFYKEEVLRAIHVALLCTNVVAAERPTMSTVVSMLEGRASVWEFVSDSNVSIANMNSEEMATTIKDDWSESISMDVPLTASSASAADLYPITLDTEYWEKRDHQ